MSDADKLSLEQRLAKLLSISIDDDRAYATDVLESLIDIGDPDDIAEYLLGFVAAGSDGDGDEGGGLSQFAQDVIKFSLGEDISVVEKDEKSTTVVKAGPSKPKILDEAAAQREEIKRREVETREKQREEQELLMKKKEEDEQRKQREAAVVAATAKKKQSELKASAGRQGQKQKVYALSSTQKSVDVKQEQSTGIRNQSSGEVSAHKKGKSQKAKKQPQKPEKGKPKKKSCGCYGNKHKPLTNCLHCGRIACEVEGVDDYCHFCGFFIEDFSSQIDSGDAKANSALKHKERLLEFDRTSAQRTHIHDDQEDYFVASTSMWATQQEQEGAREMEESRRQKFLRQKQVLKMFIN
ncbi:hypothetical protein ACHAXR_001518 [Thalassiosira sp. AJA248-18]